MDEGGKALLAAASSSAPKAAPAATPGGSKPPITVDKSIKSIMEREKLAKAASEAAATTFVSTFGTSAGITDVALQKFISTVSSKGVELGNKIIELKDKITDSESKIQELNKKITDIETLIKSLGSSDADEITKTTFDKEKQEFLILKDQEEASRENLSIMLERCNVCYKLYNKYISEAARVSDNKNKYILYSRALQEANAGIRASESPQ